MVLKLDQNIDPLTFIAGHAGYFRGIGLNNSDQQFVGELTIKKIVSGIGVTLDYKAIGIEGEEYQKFNTLFSKHQILFNEEHSLVSYDSENNLCMWSLNLNIGTTVVFEFRRMKEVGEKMVLIFGFGDYTDNEMFREEISLEFWQNGDISHNYAWGESGGVFLARSACRMSRH